MEKARLIASDCLPTLSGDRVRLRWLEDRDASALFDVFSDERVMRYWSGAAWTEASQATDLIASIRDYFDKQTLFQWGIARASDDVVIGTCTLAWIDASNRRCEIGFALRSDHWGQGLVSEATRLLLVFAFESLNMHRIEADVDPRNEASIRLLSKLGFQREGYLRERWLVGSEACDTVFFGLLRSEWHSQP